MSEENIAEREAVVKKNKILDDAKTLLKKEFFGIDEIIDRLIDLTRAWYIFPQLQRRPNVINLWGLTGVGKTSLLRRFISLIEKEGDYLLFDMRNNRYDFLEETISKFEGTKEKQSLIYIFDEFQYARTVDEEGYDANQSNKILWQILGEGFFYYWPSRNYGSIEDVLEKLIFSVSRGVKVKNGVVVDGWETHLQLLNNDLFLESDDSPKVFFPPLYLEELFDISRDYARDIFDVQKLLLSFNEIETVQFIKKVLKKRRQPFKMDCSKSLVFIVGNLDEAYEMNDNFNPDVSADEFYKRAELIDLPTIKSVLLRRFRAEQIARLGNNHLIYPSLTSDAYEKIIDMELGKIAEQYSDNFGINLTFEESVKKLVYKEGVFPTQGARQIFSTVENLIVNNIPLIYNENISLNLNADIYRISTDGENLIAEFFTDENKIREMKIKLNLSVENLRKVKNDETQTIVAVHESGHAVCGTLIMNKLPRPEKSFLPQLQIWREESLFSKTTKNSFPRNRSSVK